MTLTTNHKRRLLATLVHVDDILDRIEQVLASARSTRAFPHFVADITPGQARAVSDCLAKLREAMLATLPELGLEPPAPTVSALRALRVQAIAAEIALEDSRAATMRGYGELSPEDAAAIERVVGELHRQVEHLSALLAQPPEQA